MQKIENEIEKLKNEYSDIDETTKNINTLLNLIIVENFGEKISIIYSILNDNDKFSQLLNAFGGMTVSFPTIEEFKSSITLSLIYYYKEIMNFSWKKIEKLIPYEKDISLKYGSKIKTLQKSIRKYLNQNKNNENIEKGLFED